jgi:hypothetical protein
MCFGRRRGEVIGDEPDNTDSDPDSSEKAVPQGEGRTKAKAEPAYPINGGAIIDHEAARERRFVAVEK